jgi:KUP system potassium uptake protein
VYGVLSLIVWSLILIVTVQVRPGHHAPGQPRRRRHPRPPRTRAPEAASRRSHLARALRAALLYGDGIITPAISVLSAVEGLEVTVPELRHVVVPATFVILLLFMVQRFGTARVGGVFGPVMLGWFATVGILGGMEIARAPEILLAFNPWYVVQVFVHHRMAGFRVLGAVVLAITGAEALYADMGHFGRGPIRLAWFAVALPAPPPQLLRSGRRSCACRRHSRIRSTSWRRPRSSIPFSASPRWPLSSRPRR